MSLINYFALLLFLFIKNKLVENRGIIFVILMKFIYFSLETAISGGNNTNEKIKELEDQLASEQEKHRQQIKDITSQYENQITAKQLECNVSLVSALGKFKVFCN